MARSHGKSGRWMIDTTSAASGSAVLVTNVADWSIDQSSDDVDVSAMSDTTHVYVSGLANATGSFKAFIDLSTVQFANITNGTARKFYLYPDYSNAPTQYWYGTGIFSGSYSGGVSAANEVSVSWKAASSVTAPTTI